MTVRLTTIGPARVEIDVTPAALEEAAGGATVWVVCWRGTPLEERVAYTLTEGEATQLVCDLANVLEEAPAS